MKNYRTKNENRIRLIIDKREVGSPGPTPQVQADFHEKREDQDWNQSHISNKQKGRGMPRAQASDTSRQKKSD